MKIFEQEEFARANLITLLMSSFEKWNLYVVSKNFLRFCKGRGFKEISLSNPKIGIEDTYSDFFLKRIGD